MGNKILIVDDEPDLLTDIGTILEIKGYEVIMAPDGQTGIDKAISELPDLILCDIMMPRVDGYEVLKQVSDHNETSTIPFLFMSAKSTREDIREGMNLGADDYISKPFDLDELLEAVSTRIKKAENTQDLVSKKFEEIREVMSRTLPHEFRTPLNSILGYSNYLIKNYEETDTETAIDMLETINNDAKRLNRLFENYLSYTQLAAATENPAEAETYRNSTTEIPEVIMKDVIMMTAHGSEINPKYSLTDKEFNLAIDRKHFTKMIHELVDNAIKFTEDSDFFKIDSRLAKKSYEIIISNYGRQLTNDQLEKISAFSQIDRNKYEQQGAGMGLAIVKKTIELYNGAITVRTTTDGWTELKLKLPLAKG